MEENNEIPYDLNADSERKHEREIHNLWAKVILIGVFFISLAFVGCEIVDPVHGDWPENDCEALDVNAGGKCAP